MFTVEYRTKVREELIEKAHADPRIESAAAVGGSAQGETDRWSDLDLAFGIAPDASLESVLADWTRDARRQFEAVTLFDLPRGKSIYRVFLLPGSLQVDLSFTPGAEFGALGPRFALLFGAAAKRDAPPSPSPRSEFGLATHHVVRARICVARGSLWQAEHWTSLVRDHALALACIRLGLEVDYGRGFDALPIEIREQAANALVRSTQPGEVLRALRGATELLLSESAGVHEDSTKIESLLREVLE
ncbi:MAG TPA: nucleotidyltransferase domain-containing protein [Candidatus Dormibacteraeota bacterium]